MSIVSRAAFFFASGSLAAFPVWLGGILLVDDDLEEQECLFRDLCPFQLFAVAVVWGKRCVLGRDTMRSLF